MTSQNPPPTLILVRHAQPEVDPGQPAASWPLSPVGRAAAIDLGERLRAFGNLRIAASNEVKAIETADAIAPGQPITSDVRFSEQGRGTVPFLPGSAFREQVVAHFAHPDDRLLGDESSREASARFDAAINDHIGNGPDGTIPVIVAHGRILTAWLMARANPDHGEPVAASDLWASLQMPDAFLLHPDDGDRDRWIWRRLDREGAQ